MTGIYGGDGAQLSLQATFPNLRALELEHGSVIRGLAGQSVESRARFLPSSRWRPASRCWSLGLPSVFSRRTS